MAHQRGRTSAACWPAPSSRAGKAPRPRGWSGSCRQTAAAHPCPLLARHPRLSDPSSGQLRPNNAGPIQLPQHGMYMFICNRVSMLDASAPDTCVTGGQPCLWEGLQRGSALAGGWRWRCQAAPPRLPEGPGTAASCLWLRGNQQPSAMPFDPGSERGSQSRLCHGSHSMMSSFRSPPQGFGPACLGLGSSGAHQSAAGWARIQTRSAASRHQKPASPGRHPTGGGWPPGGTGPSMTHSGCWGCLGSRRGRAQAPVLPLDGLPPPAASPSARPQRSDCVPHTTQRQGNEQRSVLQMQGRHWRGLGRPRTCPIQKSSLVLSRRPGGAAVAGG